MSDPLNQARLSTGVPGLDQMIGGGLLEGDATLVAGSPGTGKTTLGLHYLAAGVAEGEPGVFLTFEYLPQQIYRDAKNRGWDLRTWEDKGLAKVVCSTPELMLAKDDDGQSLLDDVVEEIGARRLVIDSMTHFEMATMQPLEMRAHINGLMNHLRMLEITPLITHEIPQIVGPQVTISEYGLEFLVDSVVLLRYVELEGELKKAINVLKFRGSDHDRSYRLLRLTEDGMVVEADMSDVENITGGTARRRFTDRARELV